MDYVLLAVIGAVAALVFAAVLMRRTAKQPQGTDKMIKISKAISKGATAYLKRQYVGVGIFFAVVFVLLLMLSFFDLLSIFVSFAFLSGGIFSALAGYIGMKTATMANCRTAAAAEKGLNKGLKVAFAGGSVMGFVVVGLGLLDLSV